MTKHEVGGYVDGWCTRCKLVLRHTIEAIAGGKITRVHCNTCRGQHAYRPQAPRAPGAAGGSSTRARRSAPEPPANNYHTLLRGRTKDASRPYSTSEHYAVGDLVAHATFGLGVVTGARDTNKIDVVFPDGPKVLLQGR
jgi:hypothetical protein